MADGTLKVGQITNSAGSGNITIGSGVTVNVNRPAFSITPSSGQSLANGVFSKVVFDTEEYDTDSAFADSKFTVPSGQAGKYCFISCPGSMTLSDGKVIASYIYKNGSALSEAYQAYGTSGTSRNAVNHVAVLDLSVGDYIEIYAYQNQGSAETPDQTRNAFFRGYKLGA